MADESAGGKPDSKGVPLSAVFSSKSLVSPEQSTAVVGRVLNVFSSLPIAAKNLLRTAVNEEITPTTGGFRRGQAGRALDRSGFLIQDQVVLGVTTSNVLAAAVLQCWAESHPSLREAVERHRTGRGLSTPGPDLAGRLFRGHWLMDQWEAERESFAQTYDDDFDPEDVALMMCYVSGNFPPTSDRSSAEGGDITLDAALSSALSALRELPATAQEWERLIPDFVSSVSRVIEEKAAQLRWYEEFDAILQSVRESYPELLGFFEQDTQHWVAARVSNDVDTNAVLRLASKLHSQLGDYKPIHDRAASISEERERALKRELLQPSILGTLQEIAALMTGETIALALALAPTLGRTITSEPSVAPDQSTAPAHGTREQLTAVSPAATKHPTSEPTPAQTPPRQGPVASAEAATPQPTASIATAEAPKQPTVELNVLESENVGLRDNATALVSENQNLKDEVETLRAELFGSQEREDSWRLAYRSAMDGSLEEVGVAPPVVESVLDAVEMAKARFKQELLFAPNSDSNIEENPFIDPLRVWEALQWLGTTYYASRMGRLRVTDFDQSVKEACGWWYKGDQGETTVSKFEKSYTTRVDGKRYTLVEHIGKGTTFDARYTIRIAFEWDRDQRRVVVGYIGRHQQTDAS